MEGEDYFGIIAVPDNENEEDAANDLTFGDIGELKAGDDASDAFWKPDHQSLSRRIEEEKEVVQRSRLAPTSSRPVRRDLYENPVPVPPKEQDAEPSTMAWNRLLQAVQGQHASHLEKQPVHSSQGQSFSFRNPSISDHTSQLASNAQSQNPPPISPLINPQEYERTMIAYYEQQMRQFLIRHDETAELQLREAIVAQNAGVVFDKAKFDEHQEAARQRIVTDFYNRVNQIRYLVWLQTRQLVQRNLPTWEQSQTATRDDYDLEGQSQKNILETLRPDIRPRLFENGREQTSINLSPTFSDYETNGSARASGALQNKTKPNVSRDPIKKAVGMQELERQLMESGIDISPTTKNDRKMSNAPLDGRETRRYGKKECRLESMTDKDQELVFRVHLRQVEAAVTYKDDYYHGMYRRNERLGLGELYSDLAKNVNQMRQRNQLRGTNSRPHRSRRTKHHTQQNENQASSPVQSSDSSKNGLATALGSVQTWNPKAPRRVMDFSSIERKAVKGSESKLLRDDERVKVRHEIERGYDVMAVIHDIVRGESSEVLEDQIRNLLETLHIENTHEERADSDIATNPGLRFFGTLCVLEKGRRYLARVFDILDISERIRVIPSVFESLGVMIYSLQRSRRSYMCGEGDIVSKCLEAISDFHISAADCIAMLSSFSSTHSARPDAFLTTFRSASGAKLMYCCMQRVSRGLFKKEIGEEDVSRSGVCKLAKVYTEMLQRIFEGAELVNRVWEVTASLDSILTGETRSELRAELKRLLRSGTAPPPPQR
ncbi:unnamed protein product [Agarophyton chilense]|eukprot:gb/GEZJ01002208.1/.p1 GENE.gb/GEZJ01002208.1/~~gb/GEZJ01002208.1/.p1  ORF type:complete len:776 (+),score=96.64 gb/GEZJ01002208.1/:534-2861(+)